jgi:hypothetical protein
MSIRMLLSCIVNELFSRMLFVLELLPLISVDKKIRKELTELHFWAPPDPQQQINVT